MIPVEWIRTCFRATFIVCCILFVFGLSAWFYLYSQSDRLHYKDKSRDKFFAGEFLINKGHGRISVAANARQARSPKQIDNCVHQGNVSTEVSTTNTHQVGNTHETIDKDVINSEVKPNRETNNSVKEDNYTHKVKSSTETHVSGQDNSATHQINPPKEVKLDSKDKQDNSPSANVNQVKSSNEAMKKDNSPTHQPIKESESPIDPLSSIIQMNSTHINGKLLEPVDTEWDENIYFSVKTTAKYFKERLAALMPTWFQVINKRMLTVVSEKSDIGTAMATVMKEAGLNLLLTDCVGTHTSKGLCCKSGSEFAAYYEAVDKYQDERKSFEWFCHFDDDMYVNVPELNNLLQQHDPRKPYYIGSSDKPKVVHQVENDTLEKLKKENITVASNSYQLASGAAYCISHPLMMELKHLLNGGKAFNRMCAVCDRIDDHMIGFSIVSILGYSRELSGKIKTQQSKHLDSVTLKDMLKYVCVAPNGTTRQKYLEPYAESINMSLSEDPTRFLTYHCLLYPTVSWCHK